MANNTFDNYYYLCAGCSSRDCSGANAGTYFAGRSASHHTGSIPSTAADTISGQLATIDISPMITSANQNIRNVLCVFIIYLFIYLFEIIYLLQATMCHTQFHHAFSLPELISNQQSYYVFRSGSNVRTTNSCCASRKKADFHTIMPVNLLQQIESCQLHENKHTSAIDHIIGIHPYPPIQSNPLVQAAPSVPHKIFIPLG